MVDVMHSCVILKSFSMTSSAHNLKGEGKNGGASDDSTTYALTHTSAVTGFRQSDAPKCIYKR